MADFQFVKNHATSKTVIQAPRRAKRTNSQSTKPAIICPFCIGRENDEEELYRVSANGKSSGDDWKIRVIKNKFPFVSHHEIVILSPDHHKSFDELPFSQIELILYTYRQRYNSGKAKGQVYIFHNGGLGSGESIPHPHSQIAIVSKEIQLEIPPLPAGSIDDKEAMQSRWGGLIRRSTPRNDRVIQTDYFQVFCPLTSEWPDEVWVAPKKRGSIFGEISDDEITDLAFIISRLIQLFDARHGHEFPFNFYIYPGKDWYFRLIPRMRILGGFELGTGVMVNTQDPDETLSFIKEHFWEPDLDKIRKEQQADYLKSV